MRGALIQFLAAASLGVVVFLAATAIAPAADAAAAQLYYGLGLAVSLPAILIGLAFQPKPSAAIQAAAAAPSPVKAGPLGVFIHARPVTYCVIVLALLLLAHQALAALVLDTFANFVGTGEDGRAARFTLSGALLVAGLLPLTAVLGYSVGRSSRIGLLGVVLAVLLAYLLVGAVDGAVRIAGGQTDPLSLAYSVLLREEAPPRLLDDAAALQRAGTRALLVVGAVIVASLWVWGAALAGRAQRRAGIS